VHKFGLLYPPPGEQTQCNCRLGIDVRTERLIHSTVLNLAQMIGNWRRRRPIPTLSLLDIQNGDMTAVSRLLDEGASVNAFVGTGGEFESATPLAMAAAWEHAELVTLLLDRGANINAVGGFYGTALAAIATQPGDEKMASLLLDRGADMNAWGGFYGTPLAAAVAQRGNEKMVSLLLDRGANINAVGPGCSYGTPLAAAIAQRDNKKMVSLLLDHGADINSALALALARGQTRIASRLLDRGADTNAVGGEHGTALAAAIASGNEHTVLMLLDRGVDINAVGGKHRTTLASAIASGNQHTVSLLLDRGVDINAVGGEHRTALAAAIASGHEQIISLLLDRGVDINAVGGEHRTALAAAIATGREHIVSLILGRVKDINAIGEDHRPALAVAIKDGDAQTTSLLLDWGADVNIVCGDFGTVLGLAVSKGDVKLVSLLLEMGADANHIGGKYHTGDGYPTAMDAARSSGMCTPGLIALLAAAMERQRAHAGGGGNGLVVPPFPMPYPMARGIPSSIRCHQPESDFCRAFGAFRAGDALPPEIANAACQSFSEDVLIRSLTALVGIHQGAVECLQSYIRTDIRYFVSQGFDFGLAYAAARVGWKHFNESPTPTGFDVVAQRGRWLARINELHEGRKRAISIDDTKQELINSPYSIMPRRIWDLKSNRVVDFAMLHSQHQSMCPPFWAVSHSWTSNMEAVETSINEYQWPVPLPKGIDLIDLRKELLNFGAEYVWLDVLCLRQKPAAYSQSSLNTAQQDEWKVDVPTIGNIYRAATQLVRYFNGLGKPFCQHGWGDNRHWLRRAWTLQEIRTENTTFNGGLSGHSGSILMNQKGTIAGKEITLRQALRPVLRLAANVDSDAGCNVYELVREMSKRCASHPLDKVAGLFYLLRTTQLPTYDAAIDEESAWRQCFHVLPFGRKLEILFDCPFRGKEKQWFPTWRQMMEWPVRDPECDHAPAELPQGYKFPQLIAPEQHISVHPWFYVHDIWAISKAPVRKLTELNEYEVTTGGITVGFFCPYLAQTPITLTEQLLTLAIIKLGHTYNWAVCEELEVRSGPCNMSHENEEVVEVRIHILKKVGVLRTDSSGELLVADRNKSPSVKKINALFV